jgi:putative transposase
MQPVCEGVGFVVILTDPKGRCCPGGVLRTVRHSGIAILTGRKGRCCCCRPPLLVISDGAPGLLAAIELHLRTSLRQRCTIHRARNLLAKVSTADQAEVKADYWAILDLGDGVEPGEVAVAIAQRQAEAFTAKWQRRYPAAVACVTDDLPSLTVHLRFPPEHWRRIRHSNSQQPADARSAITPSVRSNSVLQ